MTDYTPYVAAVYLLALVAYGGSTLLWSSQLKRAQTRLNELRTTSSGATDPT